MFNKQHIMGLVVTILACSAAMVILDAIHAHTQIAGTIVLLMAVYGVAVTANLGLDDEEPESHR